LFSADQKEASIVLLISRARHLVIALAVLALTAGVALAGRSALSTPTAASDGLQRASEAAGKTVPVAGEVEETAPDADADTDEDADTDAPAVAGEHPDNHGKLVSEAARAATPAGFDNHGEYVKSVATVNAGHAADAQRGASKTKAPSH
jgi:hypothetical protein